MEAPQQMSPTPGPQPGQPAPRKGWPLAGAGCLGLILGVLFGIAGLTLVFYDLGWEIKGEDAAANFVLTLAITTPQACIIGMVGMILAMAMRKERILSLLPVLTTVAISCLILWLGSEWVEARQMALKVAADDAIQDNGFFLTKSLAKQLSWKTFFLIFVMLFTAIIDIFLLPFVVLFDPDVLREGIVLLLIFLGLSVGGALASSVLWWPLILKKR